MGAVPQAGASAPQMVSMEFEKVYGHNAVAAVNMVYDQSTLGPMVAEYEQVWQNTNSYILMVWVLSGAPRACVHNICVHGTCVHRTCC